LVFTVVFVVAVLISEDSGIVYRSREEKAWREAEGRSSCKIHDLYTWNLD
jgi:hypothetical protein